MGYKRNKGILVSANLIFSHECTIAPFEAYMTMTVGHESRPTVIVLDLSTYAAGFQWQLLEQDLT